MKEKIIKTIIGLFSLFIFLPLASAETLTIRVPVELQNMHQDITAVSIGCDVNNAVYSDSVQIPANGEVKQTMVFLDKGYSAKQTYQYLTKGGSAKCNMVLINKKGQVLAPSVSSKDVAYKINPANYYKTSFNLTASMVEYK